MKKLIVDYKDLAIKVHSSEDNTSIIDSYRIESPQDMKNILKLIRDEVPSQMAVHKRTLNSMILEWRSHNLLYSLGILRDRTKSVDLNINQPWYAGVLYFIMSLFYFHF